jgi:hypothetical protein
MANYNITKCFISGVKLSGGIFNDKAAALYNEDGKLFLLSNVKDFQAGEKPANMRSYQASAYLGMTASVNPESIPETLKIMFGVNSMLPENNPEYQAIAARKAAFKRGANKQTPAPVEPVTPEPAPAAPTMPETSNPQPSTPEPMQTPNPANQAAPAAAAPAVDTNNAIGALVNLLAPALAGSVEAAVLAKIQPVIAESLAKQVARQEITVNGPRGTSKVEGVLHSKFQTVLKRVAAGVPVFMYGPAGSGKNVLAEQIAKALNLDFYFSGAVQNVFDLLGYGDANGNYIETPFYKACVNGGVFFFDEIDASDNAALVKFNAATANRYVDFPVIGRVNIHPDTRFIAAGNTAGSGANSLYTGRVRLDAATLNRWAKVEIDYCPAIEDNAAAGDAQILEFVRNLRTVAKSRGLAMVLSPRQMAQMATDKAESISPRESVTDCILSDMQADNVRLLANGLNCSPDNRYYQALKEISNEMNY